MNNRGVNVSMNNIIVAGGGERIEMWHCVGCGRGAAEGHQAELRAVALGLRSVNHGGVNGGGMGV